MALMCRFKRLAIKLRQHVYLAEIAVEQLLIGMSTSRYFAASGTAGLARFWVNGNSRVPAPPPITIARVLSCVVFSFIISCNRFAAILSLGKHKLRVLWHLAACGTPALGGISTVPCSCGAGSSISGLATQAARTDQRPDFRSALRQVFRAMARTKTASTSRKSSNGSGPISLLNASLARHNKLEVVVGLLPESFCDVTPAID